MATINEGDKVSWEWGDGTASGTVRSIFQEKTICTIDGSEVIRKGSKEDPALYIENTDGNNALKLSSEVEKVQ